MTTRERIVYALGVTGYGGLLVAALNLAGFARGPVALVASAVVIAALLTLACALCAAASSADDRIEADPPA